MRRLISFIMFVSMILTLALPALATDTTGTEEDVTDYEYSYVSFASYTSGSNSVYVTSRPKNGVISHSIDMPLEFDYFLIGADYSTISDWDPFGSYKLVLSFYTGVWNSFDISADPLAFLSASTVSSKSMLNIRAKSDIECSVSAEYHGDGSYTFTFDNITYDQFKDYTFIFASFYYDNITSVPSDPDVFDIYLTNFYFGLESVYDQEAYERATAQKLDDIHQQMIENEAKEEERHEETKGLLGRIIDGITSIPGKIKDAIKGLIDDITSSITGTIQSAFNDFLSQLKDKLGILYQAPDYFIRVISSILVTEKSNSFVFPSMIIPVNGEEYTVNDPMEYQIFPDWIPSAVYTFINVAMSIVVIFGVINYAEKKWEDITKNG